MIIVGDVGGTKTRLAAFTMVGEGLTRGQVERFESAAYKSLEEIVSIFLAKHSLKPRAACFGIPGPVTNGTVKATNLPWFLSERDISSALNIPHVKLVNDLVATASSIPVLSSQDITVLHSGQQIATDGSALIIAPGTGMGQAILVKTAGKYSVLPSEGGHSNFAPSNEIEFKLFQFLENKYGHASVERVLCGPGLVNIYDFLKENGLADEPRELQTMLENHSAASVITRCGQEGTFEICVKALEIFISALGSHCHNLALHPLCSRGVYLGGGVPPKILQKLKDGSILKTYLSRGKMQKQIDKTPLYVINDDHAALTGAAKLAAEMLF